MRSRNASSARRSATKKTLTAPRLLHFEHVNVLRAGREVIHDLSLAVECGQHLAVVGPNGAGKSTLLKLITRECYPVPSPATTCRILGRDRWNVFDLRGELGMVSSDLSEVLSPQATVRAIALTGFFSSYSLELNHTLTWAMERAADDALEQLGIAHLAQRQIETLSSGELRRATIARALVHRPQALIFDEPANSLDLAAQREVRDAMRALARSGVAIVLVTHQPGDVIPEIERVVFMRDGRIVADGAKAELFTAQRLGRLYGVEVELRADSGYYYAR